MSVSSSKAVEEKEAIPRRPPPPPPATVVVHKKRRVRPGSIQEATEVLGRVPYGESSRKYRRDVYTHSDWVKHRSEARVFANLRGIFFSGVIRQLRNEAALITGMAVFCVVWNDLIVPGAGGDAVLPCLKLPLLPFTISSPALGLLLVFRTNASYQRWLEARVRWGTIESNAKNMVRMGATFCDTSSHPQNLVLIEELAQAAWLVSRSIMNQLAGPTEDQDADYEAELRQVYGNDDPLVEDMMAAAPHRAHVALMEASLALDAIPVDEKRRVEADKSLVMIGETLSACERIFKSPVPLVYTRHTSRFLSIWMILLPFSIHDEFLKLAHTGLPTIPAAAVLSLFLFGIEELAVQLEEPFSILPMQNMCDTIRQDTVEMVNWSVASRKRYRRTPVSMPPEEEEALSVTATPSPNGRSD